METQYKFTTLESIESLTDTELAKDRTAREMLSKGMPREAYVNYLIVQEFINQNVTESHVIEIDRQILKLLSIAPAQCAAHYKKDAAELKKNYESIINLEFLETETVKNLTFKF